MAYASRRKYNIVRNDALCSGAHIFEQVKADLSTELAHPDHTGLLARNFRSISQSQRLSEAPEELPQLTVEHFSYSLALRTSAALSRYSRLSGIDKTSALLLPDGILCSPHHVERQGRFVLLRRYARCR